MFGVKPHVGERLQDADFGNLVDEEPRFVVRFSFRVWREQQCGQDKAQGCISEYRTRFKCRPGRVS